MIATPADSELIFRPEVRLYLYRAAAILSRLRGRGPPSGGGGGCRLRDLRHNPGGPLLHVRDGETQDKDTFVGEKPSCSALIRVMLFVMDRTIHLHAQFRAGTVEVEDEWANWVVATKVQA
jgi:hypothetical protein